MYEIINCSLDGFAVFVILALHGCSMFQVGTTGTEEKEEKRLL
jgi:hypothetical protein